MCVCYVLMIKDKPSENKTKYIKTNTEEILVITYQNVYFKKQN